MGLVRQYYSDALTEASARALIWYLRNDTYFTQSLESDERVLLVKYENLVCDPESELHRIFEFLGLELVKKAFSHLSTSSMNRYDNPEIADSIAELCSGMSDRLAALVKQRIRKRRWRLHCQLATFN